MTVKIGGEFVSPLRVWKQQRRDGQQLESLSLKHAF